jgi:hypothetical protein
MLLQLALADAVVEALLAVVVVRVALLGVGL